MAYFWLAYYLGYLACTKCFNYGIVAQTQTDTKPWTYCGCAYGRDARKSAEGG